MVYLSWKQIHSLNAVRPDGTLHLPEFSQLQYWCPHYLVSPRFKRPLSYVMFNLVFLSVWLCYMLSTWLELLQSMDLGYNLLPQLLIQYKTSYLQQNLLWVLRSYDYVMSLSALANNYFYNNVQMLRGQTFTQPRGDKFHSV